MEMGRYACLSHTTCRSLDDVTTRTSTPTQIAAAPTPLPPPSPLHSGPAEKIKFLCMAVREGDEHLCREHEAEGDS